MRWRCSPAPDDDELGLRPSAALRALHQRVIEQDDNLAATPTQARPAAAAPGARLASVSNPADLPLAVADALGAPLAGTDPKAAVRGRLLA
jgi:hypothetical protein